MEKFEKIEITVFSGKVKIMRTKHPHEKYDSIQQQNAVFFESELILIKNDDFGFKKFSE